MALKGIEAGYRQCFRALPPDLSQHHTLCETYEFLCVDILGKKTTTDIIDDLKSGKAEFEFLVNKAKARDAAFMLMYLILLGDFENEVKDSTKIFNAVLYIVSHSAVFKWSTRKVLRAAYEERFVISEKQKTGLDKWEKTEADLLAEEDEEDVTTDEEDLYLYDSDYDTYYLN